MHLIERTCPTAAENVALDEALLVEAEAGVEQTGWLRIWEPAEPFVVVGRGSSVSNEVDLARCARDGVPVLRRVSGGAAVVASRGCLMYAVVLSYERYPGLRAIDHAHRYVLETMASALAVDVPGIQREGISDLAVNGRKVSGNSLRCCRHWMLYHGTLLYDMPLDLISCYLRTPPRQPDYRAGRRHADFVANMDISASKLRRAITTGWNARLSSDACSEQSTLQLVADKYATSGWTMQIP